MSVDNARVHSYIKRVGYHYIKKKVRLTSKTCRLQNGKEGDFRNETLSFIFSKAVLYQPCLSMGMGYKCQTVTINDIMNDIATVFDELRMTKVTIYCYEHCE